MFNSIHDLLCVIRTALNTFSYSLSIVNAALNIISDSLSLVKVLRLKVLTHSLL